MRLFILILLSTLFLTACTDAKKTPITPLERIDTPAVVIDVPTSGVSVSPGAISDQKHTPIPPPEPELSPVVSETQKSVQSTPSVSPTSSNPLPPPELPPLPDMQ